MCSNSQCFPQEQAKDAKKLDADPTPTASKDPTEWIAFAQPVCREIPSLAAKVQTMIS